jgi:hypothetical protein
MADISATLNVNFITQNSGPHRICYRKEDEVEYTCITVDECIPGFPCSNQIDITVDDAEPDQVIEGYVQSTCEVITSEDGRIPFEVIHQP